MATYEETSIGRKLLPIVRILQVLGALNIILYAFPAIHNFSTSFTNSGSGNCILAPFPDVGRRSAVWRTDVAALGGWPTEWPFWGGNFANCLASYMYNFSYLFYLHPRNRDTCSYTTMDEGNSLQMEKIILVFLGMLAGNHLGYPEYNYVNTTRYTGAVVHTNQYRGGRKCHRWIEVLNARGEEPRSAPRGKGSLIGQGVVALRSLPGSWFFPGSRRQHEGREAPDRCVRRGHWPPPFPRSRPPASPAGTARLAVRSSADRSCRRPPKIGRAGPKMVQQHRELAGHRDPRLLHADPIGQGATPSAQRARPLQAADQDGRRLVQIAAQESEEKVSGTNCPLRNSGGSSSACSRRTRCGAGRGSHSAAAAGLTPSLAITWSCTVSTPSTRVEASRTSSAIRRPWAS